MAVRDLIVIEEQKIIITVCSEDHIQARIASSFWDNVYQFFGGKEDEESPLGSLSIFRVIGTEPWHVEKIFYKTFTSQATCLSYDSGTNSLAVGMANGKIKVFEVPNNFEFIKGVPYESNEIEAHTGKVTGICMDPYIGYVYSIGTDGNLCVSDRTSCEHYWTKKFDKFELTSLLYDEENRRVFIGDNAGVIHVFSIKKYPPKRLTSIQTSVRNAIKTMTTSEDMKKLFAGTSDGHILCFDLGRYGKEKKETQEYPY